MPRAHVVSAIARAVRPLSAVIVLAACGPPPAPPKTPEPVAVAPAVVVPAVPKDMTAPRERTEAELQGALERDVFDADAWEELARLHYRSSEQRPGARILAREVVAQGLATLARRGRESADLLATRGLLALAAGRREAAREDLAAAVRLDPRSRRALWPLAMLALGARDFVAARAALAAISEQRIGRDNPDVWLALGVAERGLGRFREAEGAYHRAIELAPTDPRPWFNLGVLYDHLRLQPDVDLEQAERLGAVARSHFNKFLELTRESNASSGHRDFARNFIAGYDQNFRSFGHPRLELRKMAKEMEELQKRQQWEERLRLLELERRSLAEEAAEQAREQARR